MSLEEVVMVTSEHPADRSRPPSASATGSGSGSGSGSGDPRAAAYRTVRTRVDTMLRERGADAAASPVPCCPRWTVRDTLSHLVGACADVLAGRTEGAGLPDWTAKQVESLHDRTIPQLLDEWAVTSEQVLVALDGRSALGQMLMDALTHEYDLRSALGLPPHAQDPLAELGLEWLGKRFGRYLDSTGTPALGLDDGTGRVIVLGSGEPGAVVRADPADVLRILTGRRSRDQIRAMGWTGDPTPYLAALDWGIFSPPDHAVEPATS